MDVSIVVVNWNTCHLLSRCLEAVFETVQGLDFELFVVDNGSTDGSPVMVRERFPQVRLIENAENLGFARANNQAIQESCGRYVMLLNSDAFLMESAAEEMVRLMNAHSEVGIAGANLFYPDGRLQLSHAPLPSLASEILSLTGLDKLPAVTGKRTSYGDCVETGTVSGACLQVRRTTLDQIGLLDESYFMFSEEVDLCRRAYQAGWKVAHIPAARVIHVCGGSTGTTPDRILMLYKGKLQYFAKHHDPIGRLFLLAVIWLTTLGKVFAYNLLKAVRFGSKQKETLWSGVARGLVKTYIRRLA